YLIEPENDILKIQAATGYHKALVEEEASYNLQGKKGITAWIAREGLPFKANSEAELREHPHWAGTYLLAQGDQTPNAFLGIPLKVFTTGGREAVIGVLKVEDVRPSSRHPEAYFTDQDQLLVEMMGNVITTVIQNTRVSEVRQRDLRSAITECLNSVIQAEQSQNGHRVDRLVERMMKAVVTILPKTALEVLRPFTSSHNKMVIDALSTSLLSALLNKRPVSFEAQITVLAEQTQTLLSFSPNPALFQALAEHSTDLLVKRWYHTTYSLYQNETINRTKILDALRLELPWHEARETGTTTTSDHFRQVTKRLAAAIAAIIREQPEPLNEIGLWTAFKLPNIISNPDIHFSSSHLPV